MIIEEFAVLIILKLRVFMLISFVRFKPARLNTNSALKLTFRERPGPSIFLRKKTSARTVPENQPLLDLLLFRFVYYAIHTGETDLPQKSCQQVGRKMCCQVHHSEIVQSSCWHLEKVHHQLRGKNSRDFEHLS